MPSLIVRPFEDRDIEGYFHARDMTYNNGVRTPPENRVFKTTQPFVAELDGQVVGCFNVLDLSCNRGDRANLKCAGIAGVAVAPEFRHLGVGSRMMSWAVPHLKAQGYHMASLYGFREGFYRKFGYQVCGLKVEISCPSHRLPRLAPELPVRKIPYDAPEPLQACLESFAKNLSGMNIRNDMHWGRVLDEKKSIYAVGDPVEAYAIVDHAIDFWVPQRINEVVWSTPAGYRSILAVLSSIAINKSSLTWYEPSTTPFYSTYLEQGVEAKIVRPIMYRLLDVPGALAALSPVGAGSFSVTIEDDLISDNSGVWLVQDDGATVSVSRGDQAGPSIDIRAWVQIYLGQAGAGQWSNLPPAAQRFLPESAIYCQEFF